MMLRRDRARDDTAQRARRTQIALTSPRAAPKRRQSIPTRVKLSNLPIDVAKTETEKRNESESQNSRSQWQNLVPELARTASAPGATSRSNLPYPSFNKAHSKEAVNSRDDIRLPIKPKSNPYTPESTDLGADEKARSKSADHFTPPRTSNVNKETRPPSPPETEFSQHRKATPTRLTKAQDDSEANARPGSRNSWFGRTTKEGDDKSKVSMKSKGSKASTIKSPKFKDSNGVTQENRDSGIGSVIGSNVTSVAQKQDAEDIPAKRPPPLDTDSSPASAPDSSPRTPTQTPGISPSSIPDLKPNPTSFIHFDDTGAASSANNSPQPPPPPPPPNVPINIPRVDYLMQNGGLLRPVQKTFLGGTPTFASQPGSSAATPVPSDIDRIFGPYFNILDQYETVINKNGSLAVATGYRSVARRLLDRLENVFNRDLSSEGCFCVMCQHPDLSTTEGSRGLGWGEVLEWVSGRRELPIWPAFDFATLGVKAGDDLAGLGITDGEPQRPGSPVKIDPDIAEEFREHFLQQSKKTKQAVNKWLSSCPQTAATPPQEVDDETLSFAILTHLEQSHRPIFNALLSGSRILQPVSRAPTAPKRPRSEFMIKTVHSLQRLYRLPGPPRDPEAAIYLLKNPHLHNLLATMSSINVSEWEILISGRFDGFLWSGAEIEVQSTDPSPAPSRGPTPAGGAPFRGPMSPALRQGSRTTTPFSPNRNQAFSPPLGSSGFPSRGPTPSQQLRQPVSNDEETEIAVQKRSWRWSRPAPLTRMPCFRAGSSASQV